MKLLPRFLFAVATLLALATAIQSTASAGTPWHFNHGRPASRADRLARYYASQRPWHGEYAYTPYGGGPVALVVPPNAKMHSSWSWGVAQTEMTPLYHQFFRDYPGDPIGGGGYPFLPTPYWPSHTDQFGVYPVRGPW